MTTCKVVFMPHNREAVVREGENLIRAAMEAGVHINASCGGEGVCGKCRVIIESGAVEGGITEKLSREDIEKGYRLACRSVIRGDATVRVPVESEVDASVLKLQFTARKKAKIVQPDFGALKEQGLFLPPVEKRYLDLPEPTGPDNMADTTRLVSFLKLHHDEHRLVVGLPMIRKLPGTLRTDHFRVTVTLARPVQSGRKSKIINIEPGDTSNRNFAIALDIGTTTIYGEVIDLKSGKVLAEGADFNGQISYGEDVITRIVFTETPGGLEKLNAVVIETINRIIDKIIRRAKVGREEISSITIAGNTTMTQLFLKVEPYYIRRSPYVPAATLYPPIDASGLGLNLGEHVEALVYPQISSYVGGDIVAGVMGSGIYRAEKLTLFMDIGTNAEIVVGNKEWLACAACSAGPAFEGGGVKFGMRAARGAIEDFSMHPRTFEPMNITIGSVRPKGICGSGLIIMVATMFEMGIVDSQGKYNRNLGTPRIRENEGVWEYVVAWQADTQIDRDIVLTEIDIENLMRAKAAIYSGCQTLLNEVGLDIGMVERIILAGGFGSYIDLEKAMTIGLLPEIDPEKVTFVGNSSLMGARMSALTNRIRLDVASVIQRMTNFELSETPSYMDHYVAALFLPHTDMDKFPRLKARLGKRHSL
ncbi:MAG: ferredoxin [Desulfobacteraceae bacterium 4572_123]|nr:MAG: ferredoxin [Desulfobacteraceae bacterium 4572_123]